MRKLLITFCSLVASVAIMSGKAPLLRGSVISGDAAGQATGVYSIPTVADGVFSLLGSTGEANGGGVLVDDVYYVTSYVDHGFYIDVKIYPYDTETWEKSISTYIYGNYTNIASDMSVDPVSGKVYGCFLNSARDGWELADMDYNLENEKATRTTVGSLIKQMSALAFDASGQLYGIDIDGVLYKIDKTTGVATRVGDTGIATKVDSSGYAPTNPASGVIDPDSGSLYWTVLASDGYARLYEVNVATAQASVVTTFAGSEVIRGLYIADPEANDGAPAAPADLEVVFAPGSLSGSLSFTAPTKTYSGESLSGNLQFRVLANGNQVAEGTVYTGVNKNVELSLPDAGKYELSVIVSNAEGDSPAATITTFIGYAAPATPEVTARDYYGSLKVEWDAITTTAFGDPLGDAVVTYRVVRYPDETVVEESTSATDIVDRIPVVDGVVAYNYGVTAIAFGTPSEEGRSNKVVTGKITPPYVESFETKSVLDCFTMIDANGDGRTWSFYNGEMRAEASPSEAADDWLISPPVAIEGFKYYVVSIDVKSESGSYPGKFELRYGTSPVAESMTAEVIPATVVTNEKYVTYKGMIRVLEDNNYYFGIHALTEQDMWWLRVTNLSVSAPVDGSAPAATTDLTLTPDFNGALSVDVAFTAPDKTISGETLSEIEKIEIFRDGESIHTINGPTPGDPVASFKDTNITEKGNHIYSVVATNGFGSGAEASATVFVGVNKPASPGNARAFETAQNGEVTIEWDAPTTYIDGTPLNPDFVTYNVYTVIDNQDVKILTGLTGTSTTFQSILPGEPQMFFYYGVTAETEAGENVEMALTEQVPLGEPYEAPYADSFAGVATEYAYGTGAVDGQTYWDFYSDGAFEDVKSQDADNGMIAMFGSEKGKWASLSTGKIDLAGFENPMLTFYVFNMVGVVADENTVEVMVNDRNGFRSAGVWKLCDFETEGWHRIEVSLAEYAGKSVQFKFVGTVGTYQYLHLDNIQVRDRLANDIAVTGIDAPERVKAGNQGAVIVSYSNYGLAAADAFTVELYRDGEKIGSRDFADMASDATGTVSFTINHDVTTPSEVEYQAQVRFNADMRPDNNVSRVLTVQTIYPNYPAVTDLTATYEEDTPEIVTLSWSAPQLSGAFEDEVTEGFEGYQAWATSGVGDWTFVDGDKGAIYGFGSFFELPGIASGSQQSFWVMNDQYQPMVDHFSSPDFYVAHSGHQYIAQMGVMIDDTPGKCNDWAISPSLCGSAQTISLFARSFFDTDPESFELLYSTTGNNVDDFILLETIKGVPDKWTQYFFDLPEGAAYFAVRCISRDCYMLMIDDVTFTPVGSGEELEIEGYNVYCNGVRVNESLVTGTEFNVSRQGDVSNVYTVTVLYRNRGESMFSNEAVPGVSGVALVETSAIGIAAAGGGIVVSGAIDLPVVVYGVDGRVVSRSLGSGSDYIAVAPGVYVVSVGSEICKLVVK